MMKDKKVQIARAYNILSRSSFSKMKEGEKFGMIRIIQKLRPIAKPYLELEEETRDKLKPQRYEEILHCMATGKPISLEDQINFKKFNSDMEIAMKEDADVEVNVDFTPISGESFTRYMESNPNFIGADFEVLADIILKDD